MALKGGLALRTPCLAAVFLAALVRGLPTTGKNDSGTDRFDGKWSSKFNEGSPRHFSISNNTIYWGSKASSNISSVTSNSLRTNLEGASEGVHVSADLVDGQLKWNNGDVWIRDETDSSSIGGPPGNKLSSLDGLWTGTENMGRHIYTITNGKVYGVDASSPVEISLHPAEEVFVEFPDGPAKGYIEGETLVWELPGRKPWVKLSDSDATVALNGNWKDETRNVEYTILDGKLDGKTFDHGKAIIARDDGSVKTAFGDVIWTGSLLGNSIRWDNGHAAWQRKQIEQLSQSPHLSPLDGLWTDKDAARGRIYVIKKSEVVSNVSRSTQKLAEKDGGALETTLKGYDGREIKWDDGADTWTRLTLKDASKMIEGLWTEEGNETPVTVFSVAAGKLRTVDLNVSPENFTLKSSGDVSTEVSGKKMTAHVDGSGIMWDNGSRWIRPDSKVANAVVEGQWVTKVNSSWQHFRVTEGLGYLKLYGIEGLNNITIHPETGAIFASGPRSFSQGFFRGSQIVWDDGSTWSRNVPLDEENGSQGNHGNSEDSSADAVSTIDTSAETQITADDASTRKNKVQPTTRLALRRKNKVQLATRAGRVYPGEFDGELNGTATNRTDLDSIGNSTKEGGISAARYSEDGSAIKADGGNTNPGVGHGRPRVYNGTKTSGAPYPIENLTKEAATSGGVTLSGSSEMEADESRVPPGTVTSSLETQPVAIDGMWTVVSNESKRVFTVSEGRIIGDGLISEAIWMQPDGSVARVFSGVPETGDLEEGRIQWRDSGDVWERMTERKVQQFLDGLWSDGDSATASVHSFREGRLGGGSLGVNSSVPVMVLSSGVIKVHLPKSQRAGFVTPDGIIWDDGREWKRISDKEEFTMLNGIWNDEACSGKRIFSVENGVLYGVGKEPLNISLRSDGAIAIRSLDNDTLTGSLSEGAIHWTGEREIWTKLPVQSAVATLDGVWTEVENFGGRVFSIAGGKVHGPGMVSSGISVDEFGAVATSIAGFTAEGRLCGRRVCWKGGQSQWVRLSDADVGEALGGLWADTDSEIGDVRNIYAVANGRVKGSTEGSAINSTNGVVYASIDGVPCRGWYRGDSVDWFEPAGVGNWSRVSVNTIAEELDGMWRDQPDDGHKIFLVRGKKVQGIPGTPAKLNVHSDGTISASARNLSATGELAGIDKIAWKAELGTWVRLNSSEVAGILGGLWTEAARPGKLTFTLYDDVIEGPGVGRAKFSVNQHFSIFSRLAGISAVGNFSIDRIDWEGAAGSWIRFPAADALESITGLWKETADTAKVFTIVGNSVTDPETNSAGLSVNQNGTLVAQFPNATLDGVMYGDRIRWLGSQSAWVRMSPSEASAAYTGVYKDFARPEEPVILIYNGTVQSLSAPTSHYEILSNGSISSTMGGSRVIGMLAGSDVHFRGSPRVWNRCATPVWSEKFLGEWTRMDGSSGEIWTIRPGIIEGPDMNDHPAPIGFAAETSSGHVGSCDRAESDGQRVNTTGTAPVGTSHKGDGLTIQAPIGPMGTIAEGRLWMNQIRWDCLADNGTRVVWVKREATQTLQGGMQYDDASPCAMSGITWSPLDLVGYNATEEDNISACMWRCGRIDHCARYSFWEAGKICHLHGIFSRIVYSAFGFRSGPASCKQKGGSNGNTMMLVLQADICFVKSTGYLSQQHSAIDSIKMDATSALNCQKSCQETPWCKHFSYDTLTKACSMAEKGAPKFESVTNVGGPKFCPAEVSVSTTLKGVNSEMLWDNKTAREMLKAAVKGGIANFGRISGSPMMESVIPVRLSPGGKDSIDISFLVGTPTSVAPEEVEGFLSHDEGSLMYTILYAVVEDMKNVSEFAEEQGVTIRRSKVAVLPPGGMANLSNECLDSPVSWADSEGDNCTTYASAGLCTQDRRPGPGWYSAWGAFQDFASQGRSAVDACCSCGGGSYHDEWPQPKQNWALDSLSGKDLSGKMASNSDGGTSLLLSTAAFPLRTVLPMLLIGIAIAVGRNRIFWGRAKQVLRFRRSFSGSGDEVDKEERVPFCRPDVGEFTTPDMAFTSSVV